MFLIGIIKIINKKEQAGTSKNKTVQAIKPQFGIDNGIVRTVISKKIYGKINFTLRFLYVITQRIR